MAPVVRLARQVRHRDQLLGLAREFDKTNRRGHGRVLEHVQKLGRERRQHRAKCHREQHMAVHLGQGKTQRQPSVFLALGQRFDARTHLFSHPRSGKQAQTQCGRHKLLHQRVQLLEPVAQLLRQQLRQQEVPSKQLHQQRHIAKRLHVASGHQRQALVRHGTQHPHHRADQQRNQPGRQRQRHRPLQTLQQPAQVRTFARCRGLEEDPPVPCVTHV